MKKHSGKRKSNKKEIIVTTGIRLFGRYGLRRVTVEEICREAGVSKMTFYKHFSNKLDLFKHIWNGWSDEIYDRLIEMEKSGATFAERMRAIVEFKVEMVSRMNQELIDDMLHVGSELETFIRDLRIKAVTRFLEFAERAVEKGEMRRIRPEFVLAFLDHLGELSKNENLRRLYPTDAEFVREINDFFFFGIMPATEKGERSL